MEPLHKGLQSELLYHKENFETVSICIDCGKRATGACWIDVRTIESKLNRVESVMVYPEDAPKESCDCHVVVDYCTDCKAVANTGCTHVRQAALVKMTQSKVDEIIRASDYGLWASCRKENYIYLVDKQGNPVPFYGFKGDKNNGLSLPYISCHIHKPKPVIPNLLG